MNVSLTGYDIGDGKLSGNSSVAFPQTALNNNTTQFYTISNGGTSDVKIDDIPALNLPFDYGALSTCVTGLTLRVGDDCQLEIKFNPSAIGPSSTTVAITYSSNGKSGILALELSGEGLLDNSVVINQVVTQADFTNTLPVEFEIVFGTEIDPATFTAADILNSGTATGVTWNIANSGDDKTFILTATSVGTDGTVAPFIMAGMVELATGELVAASSGPNTPVGFNDGPLSVTVNQGSSQSNGAATFPIVFDIQFDSPIDPSTFDVSDLINGGTATGVTWTITNNGDDQSFTLTVTGATGNGSIAPEINLGNITDIFGNTNDASSSTDNIVIYDTAAPTDNTANLQFTAAASATGNDVAVTWTAFTDTNLSNHRLITYTNAACSTGADDHGLTGSNTNSNSTIIDGLTSGTYYARVTAYDIAGNSVQSACSTDSITVDTSSPTDNGANLQFTATFDGDGSDIAVTWTAFTDGNLANHRLITYTNSSCTVGATDHGLTGSNTNSNATIIDGLADGTYYATVAAYDAAGNSTVSACSTDSIVVDSGAPVDNTANLQFTASALNSGNNVAVTWTAFTDGNLSDHRIITYTNSACSTGATDHGLTGSNSNTNSTIIDGLADGTYYATVRAYDSPGNSTVSACSTDSIIVDATLPTDNTANLQFTQTHDGDGSDIAVTWTAFTDTNLSNHRLITYTNSACTLGATDHGLTASATNSNSSIIDGLASGTYYATVTAYDIAGNTRVSACSTDSIVVDTSAPTDNGANLQFTAALDNDGNNVAVTWTAFTDTNLSDHRLITYTNSGCTLGAQDHGLTGSNTNSNATIIDGLADGSYYATVTAYDAAGNARVSSCSTDSIVVDTGAPVDNTANLQFVLVADDDGDNISVTWTAFTDAHLSDHRLITYTNSGCSTGATDHGLTSSTSSVNSTIIDGLANGTYYAKVTAYDTAGNSTQSACSTDSIIVDKTAPTDNTANLQFTALADGDGNDIAVTWTAFSDTNLTNHRLITYTNSSCSTGATDHGLTGASTNSNSTIIDGLASGTYYATVTAYDIAGNYKVSACSTDTIIVDTVAPTGNPTITFTDIVDTNGNDINISWTTFSDNLSTSYLNHRVDLYKNSGCTGGAAYSISTGSSATDTSNGSIDGIAAGTYWGTVTAIDLGGNSVTSSCSTDNFTSQPIPTILSINTVNTSVGSSTVTQFMIPTRADMPYNFVVDWGDSTSSDITSYNDPDLTHTYSTAGAKTITIRGLMGAIQFGYDGDRLKILDVTQWGSNYWMDFNNAFSGCANFNPTAVDAPDLSRVQYMSYAFYGASAFNPASIGTWDVSNVIAMNGLFQSASIFNRNIGTWNVSKVTTMNNMFRQAPAFNQNIDSWDVSKVTDMEQMFMIASTFNQPLNSWDTGSVTTFREMFRGAPAFNRPLNNWDTSSATDFYGMFYQAAFFNQDLDNWDMTSATSISNMFYGTTAFNGQLDGWDVSNITDFSAVFSTTSAFNQPLDSWRPSSGTNFTSMFWTATAFNQPIGSWDVGSATTMQYMFYNASAFNRDISSWDVSNVTSMMQMFSGATVFNQNLNAWDVSKVTTFNNMFNNATAFNSPLNNWVTGLATNMSRMFYGAASFNQNISNWDVGDVTDMSYMFRGTTVFNQPLNTWDVSKVTNMTNMFYASAFNQPLNLWSTGAVTNISYMFASSSFNQDISTWNVSNVSDMSWMFYSNTAFNQNLNTWVTTSLTNISNMFYQASAFNGSMGSWDVSHVTNMSNTFRGATVFNKNISGWVVNPNVTNCSNIFLSAGAMSGVNKPTFTSCTP